MEDWQLEFSDPRDIFDELVRLRGCSLELSITERLLVLNHRAEESKKSAAIAFRRKAIATAAQWDRWASTTDVRLTFSAFVGDGAYGFGYPDSDSREMFEAVQRILASAPALTDDND